MSYVANSDQPPNQQMQMMQDPGAGATQNPNLEVVGRFGVFTWLNEQQKAFVAQNLKRSTLSARSEIFRENDKGDCFYLIENGQVEILKKTDKNPARPVRQLRGGDHFGEIALMSNNGLRTMSARAATDCSLVYLTKSIFMQILNSIDNGLKKDYGGQFENILQSEKLEEQAQAMKAEKEAIEQRQKDLD